MELHPLILWFFEEFPSCFYNYFFNWSKMLRLGSPRSNRDILVSKGYPLEQEMNISEERYLDVWFRQWIICASITWNMSGIHFGCLCTQVFLITLINTLPVLIPSHQNLCSLIHDWCSVQEQTLGTRSICFCYLELLHQHFQGSLLFKRLNSISITIMHMT